MDDFTDRKDFKTSKTDKRRFFPRCLGPVFISSGTEVGEHASGPSRDVITEILAKEINFAGREVNIAVLAIGIDNCKMVNDTLGHKFGDVLLRSIGEKLVETVRPYDIVSYVGGDEFVILLRNSGASGAATAAKKILRALRNTSVPIASWHLNVAGSIGISLFPSDGENAHDLVHKASIALHRNKETLSSSHRFYSQKMQEMLERKLSICSSLSQAIDHGHLVVHYQPLVDTVTKKIVGAEALTRWTHPTLGPISPEEYIPIAEEMGLINKLGEYVLRKACQEWRSLVDGGCPEITMAVNVSIRQLQNQYSLLSTVKHCIKSYSIPPGILNLELTESAMMEKFESLDYFMRKARELGASLNLDDFGTGYSCLSYLSKLPFDKIKIDRSFVSGAEGLNGNTSIIKAIMMIAKTLNIKTVAEGIENEQQTTLMEDLGCDYIQGFLYGKPMGLGELQEALCREIRELEQARAA